MKLSIDVSSIPADSPDILKNFIRAPRLRTLRLEAIEYLNKQLRELNRRGTRYLEDRKCNVEMGRDMLVDNAAHGIGNFVLWSGDSDFFDPLRQLIDEGMKVSVFATVRRVAAESGELVKRGLFIFLGRYAWVGVHDKNVVELMQSSPYRIAAPRSPRTDR